MEEVWQVVYNTNTQDQSVEALALVNLIECVKKLREDFPPRDYSTGSAPYNSGYSLFQHRRNPVGWLWTNFIPHLVNWKKRFGVLEVKTVPRSTTNNKG